jgi:hypothetical protein
MAGRAKIGDGNGIPGSGGGSRITAVIGDIDFLLARYGGDNACRKSGGNRALFVRRALHKLRQQIWSRSFAQVRRDSRQGCSVLW